MRVKDIPESAVLIQDSQGRVAILESVGLAHLVEEYPTLFVEVAMVSTSAFGASSKSCPTWRKKWISSGRWYEGGLTSLSGEEYPPTP